MPRAILIIVPTALLTGGFGFFLGFQSALSQRGSHTPATSSAGESQTSGSGGWAVTFSCRSNGALCATLPTNAYRVTDPQGSILQIGTIEWIGRHSVGVQFPSTPTNTWQIEVAPPGSSCNGCGAVSPRDWGPYEVGHALPTALTVGR